MTPQLKNALLKARNDLRETAPLIHCITNPIAINDCANGILAVGGKPIMAEHPDRGGGNHVHSGRARRKHRQHHRRAPHLRFDECQGGENGPVCPISFDAVGVTCSALRRDLTHTLLREACPEILKGNDAEIRAHCGRAF